MGQEDRLNTIVVLGRVGAPHGVNGWIHIQSYTDPAENLLHYKQWLLIEGEQHEQVVVSTRFQGGKCFAKIKGYETRESAALLKNRQIGVLRSELPTLDPGDYYWSDLVGLSVVNEHDQPLGTIEYLLETGSNDVMYVTGEKGHMIPYLKETVLAIDLEAGLMRVRWDE